MRLRNILLPLALAAASMAGPVRAQDGARPANSTQTAKDKFLALKDPLIENIGTRDAVILLYIEGTGDEVKGLTFDLGVRYLLPGGKLVHIQGPLLRPVVMTLFGAAREVFRVDHSWRAATLVIDHGTPTVTMAHASDFNGAVLTFGDRLEAATRRVFPGLPVEQLPTATGTS